MMAEIHPWEITQFYWFCTWTDFAKLKEEYFPSQASICFWSTSIQHPQMPHMHNTSDRPLLQYIHSNFERSGLLMFHCLSLWVCVKTEQVRELLLRIIIKAPFLFHCMGILRTRQLLPSGCFCLMWTALRYTKWSGIHRSPMIPPRIVIILNLLSILKF